MSSTDQQPPNLQRVLIDAIPVPVFYKDAAGRYLGCNAAFENFYGTTSQAIVGKTVFEIAGPELAAVYHEHDQQLFSRPGVQIYESQVRDSHGIIHDVLFHKAAFLGADGKLAGLVGAILDVTAQKRDTERWIKLNQCFLQFGRNPESNIQRLLETCCGLLEGDSALYNRLEGGRLCVRAKVNTPAELPSAFDAAGHICTDIITAGRCEPTTIRHLPQTKYAESDAFVLPFGLQTYVGAPVRLHQQAIATVCVIYGRDLEPAAEDLNLLNIIAALIGIEEERHAAAEELQRRSEEAKRARDLALRAAQVKSEFLANMSHEIRTPLHGIVGMVELLLDSEVTTEQREQLLTIERCSELLLMLVNDALDLSRIEAGKLRIEEAELDLQTIITELVKLFKEDAARKGIALRVEFAPQLENRARGDVMRIRQVLLNLLGNAVKFTESGEITVAVKELSRAADKRTIQIRVSDTGIGIPADRIKAVFDSFTQGDASLSRKYGGVGLGLTISRKLVELMGGVLEVQSTEGKGSTFWFDLPLKCSSAGERPATDPASHHGAAAGRLDVQTVQPGQRILLAEDNELNRMIGARLLTLLGHQVECAGNGAEAVRLAAEKRYDLIFMDVQMPEMDGLEAAREIRRHESSSGAAAVPIVAMTAHVMPEDLEQCRAAGMNDYLGKPLSRAQLEEMVRKWQSRK